MIVLITMPLCLNADNHRWISVSERLKESYINGDISKQTYISEVEHLMNSSQITLEQKNELLRQLPHLTEARKNERLAEEHETKSYSPEEWEWLHEGTTGQALSSGLHKK